MHEHVEPAVAEAAPEVDRCVTSATVGLTHGLARSPASILALQRSAGNAAVMRLLARQPAPPAAPAAPAPAESPAARSRPELKPGARDANYGYDYSEYKSKKKGDPNRVTDPGKGGDVELLQLKLNWHLSAMRRIGLVVDGSFGSATAAGVIAFKQARGIKPATSIVNQETWDALDKQPAIAPAKGQLGSSPAPEYAKLHEDGLLQITLAVGFDEGGLHRAEVREIRRGLTEVRSFKADEKRAAELHAEAGRKPPIKGGELYVKENVATSLGKPVHCVLRFIAASDDGSGGAEAARVTAESINESEVLAYGGHARYGTGLDFNRNWTLIVHWDKVPANLRKDRKGDQQFDRPNDFMVAFGVGNAKAITTLESLEATGAATFFGNPEGNLGIQEEPQTHKGEFGNYLIQRAVKGQPLRLRTALKDTRYRLWLFNGCVTKEYMPALRGSGNEAFSKKNMDVITNVVPPWVITLAEGLLAYLDGVLAMDGARALVDRMQNAHPPKTDVYGHDGFEDNPIPKPSQN